MKEKELEYYSKIANWDFSKINYEEEVLRYLVLCQKINI